MISPSGGFWLGSIPIWLVIFKWYIGSCPNPVTVDHKRFISGPYKKSDDYFPTVTAFRLGIAPQTKKWLTLCATLRPAQMRPKTGIKKRNNSIDSCWFLKRSGHRPSPSEYEELNLPNLKNVSLGFAYDA